MDNQQKNAFVKDQITVALLDLLKKKKLKDISVSEIAEQAQVGRVSFYRNYTDKEDVIRQYTGNLLRGWRNQYDAEKDHETCDIHHMFGSMFAHFKGNGDFYELLYRQGLLSYVLDTLKESMEVNPEKSNLEAYVSAFIAYGIYGWIEEWFARGMTESAESMAQLLRGAMPGCQEKGNRKE